MSTVFPVELELENSPGEEKNLSHLLQGFTRDVGEGGLCIELKSFGNSAEKLFATPNALLNITINPSFSSNSIKAQGRIVWSKKTGLTPAKYFLGVEYTQIDRKSNQKILWFAKNAILVPRVLLVLGVVITVLLGGVFSYNQHLIKENARLVEQLVESAERKSAAMASLHEIGDRKISIDRELTAAHQKIKSLENSIASLSEEKANQKELFETELKQNITRQNDLLEELKKIESSQATLKTSVKASVASKKEPGAPDALKQMFGWLASHQDMGTGLVASFEGDPGLEGWAFSYDQSLVCQAFILSGQTKRAEKILKFFTTRAQTQNGLFFNAYNVSDGHPMENILHTGPNIWIGIAALQYENAVGDGQYLPLAKTIGDWAISFQDGEGGLRGGPNFDWYSTEHNLDAYAFFRMLYQITGNTKYKIAQDRLLDWIKKYAYSLKDKRINRGKGDATISTDTFSWAITAIGPKTLEETAFDPAEIISFAEANCEVKVSLAKPDGQTIQARGFDFAKVKNMGRGGVISAEWTAQMIVAYQVMAQYYESLGDKEKRDLYQDKAAFYLNELQKLIVTSPSRTGQGRGCLPYASIDNVDTGHGWRTPKGRRTGSLSGTSYGVFAWENYNPFELKKK